MKNKKWSELKEKTTTTKSQEEKYYRNNVYSSIEFDAHKISAVISIKHWS